MARCSVLNSPDKLHAYLKVVESDDGTYADEDELFLQLKKHGVVYGVNLTAVRDMVARKIAGSAVEVATGLAPVPGQPARLTYLVDTVGHGKPRERNDGGVDQRDLKFAVNVSCGDGLVRRIPPVPGQMGTDVFGKAIRVGEPANVQFKAGAGTQISESDENLLVAAIDGAVTIDVDGRVDVGTSRLVRGDVDYSTGNIVFSGDLKVIGVVRAGFSVRTEGSLVVTGGMEDACAESRSSIEIAGGAAGSGKGKLVAGTTIRLRHVENFSVTAGTDIIVQEDAVHCRLQAKDTIHARSIIGGETYVGSALECDIIGNNAEACTVIVIQGRYLLIAERENCLRALAKLATEIAVSREEMYMLVHDSMDERGTLIGDTEAVLGAIKQRCVQYRSKTAEMQARIAEIDELLESMRPPTIGAGAIYPNTILRYGEAEKEIKEKSTNVFITFDNEQIIISKRSYVAQKS